MSALVATLVGVLLAVGVLVVIRTTGQSRLTRELASVAGSVCLLLFVLINVSDWPGGFLRQFWLDHAIIGATAGSLLLAATVFLVYRYRDQQQQDLIDESIVDAGRSELVERLVDLDVALALVRSDTMPELCRGNRWRKDHRGLEWLRENLDQLDAATDDAYWAQLDPRLWARATRAATGDWRLALLEQMTRHVTGGVRDWGPILMRSRQGQRDLVAFANVRLVLLQLDREVRMGLPLDIAAVRELQHWVHRFAHLLEVDGMITEPRARLFVPPLDVSPIPPVESTNPSVRSFLDRVKKHVEERTLSVKAASRQMRERVPTLPTEATSNL